MLQYAAVHTGTLELLKKLMQQDVLRNFNLVGGTALALQMGHRVSVDIDLFTEKDFDVSQILDELKRQFTLTNITEQKNSSTQNIEYPENTQQYIKVDILKYPYKLIKPPMVIDGIRLLSKEDIIPMKLSAIANRSSRKDFYDIFFLLQEYSLKNMFELFEKKFSNNNYFHVVKSLTYFDDADKEPNPNVLKPCPWEEVKQALQDKVKEYVS